MNSLYTADFLLPEQNINTLDDFIQQYFRCSSFGQILKMIKL